MKIGFVGNINNYPYQIAREIRKRGHTVILIIADESSNKLHRPEFFDANISYPYPDWIKEIVLKEISYYKRLYCPNIGYSSYIKLLNSCDAVVTNDFAHELVALLKKDLPVINLFSGSDLDVYASKDFEYFDKLISNSFLKLLQPIKGFFLNRRKNRYRYGISKSIGVSYYPIDTNPIGDLMLKELKNSHYGRFERWNSIVLDLTYQAQPNNENFRLFSAVRFLWKKPLPKGYNPCEDKGNDIMIQGVKLFLLKNKEVNFELHLVEKGNHIRETKELIIELNLQKFVTWHKEMSLLEINEMYKNSDVVLEQFGQHIMGGAGVFPMIMGRPVICNGRRDILERIIPEKVPYCYATNAEEIAIWLEKLYKSADLREEIGKKSRDYMVRNDGLPKEADFVLSTFEDYFKKQN